MKIAVTGGIAEGKSTVLGYLRDAGYNVASSDEIARQVFASEPVQEQIAEAFALDLPLDRDLLREKLALDPELRRSLNRLMHPLVLEQLTSSPANIVEVPLLIETCLQGAFQRVWVVTCGSNEQLRRLSERLGSEEAARAMIGTQLTSRAKSAFADVIVRTNAEERTVREYVIEAVRRELD